MKILRTDDQVRREWEKYIHCSPLPDATLESDLNAFITQWGENELEEAEETRRRDSDHMRRRVVSLRQQGRHAVAAAISTAIEMAPSDEMRQNRLRERLRSILSGCADCEKVVSQLQILIADATEVSDAAKLEWCDGYVAKLRGIAIQKVDYVTAYILQNSDEFERVLEDTSAAAAAAAAQATAAAAATGGVRKGDAVARNSRIGAAGGGARNMGGCQESEQLKREILECQSAYNLNYGLWAHISAKFFRRKSIVFKEIGVVIDLPKSVAMQKLPMAIRVVRT